MIAPEPRCLEPPAEQWREAGVEDDLGRLEAQITALMARKNAAEYRLLELIAEFDRLKGYEVHGLANTAQWLNWQCGIGGVAARERVRVARALETLPKISEAFRRSVVSYSKVRAMTRVATPEDEQILLSTALRGTAAEVERHVRKFRSCERRDETAEANARHRRRYLSIFHGEDGSIVIHAVLPPEVGALVQRAIEAAVEDVDEAPADDIVASPDVSAETCAVTAPEPPLARESTARAAPLGTTETETRSNVSAETSRPDIGHRASFGARRADALRRLAEAYLEHKTNKPGSVADRYQVAVHIDQRLLARGSGEASARGPQIPQHCEIEGADRPLAIETARRLACDASLVGIVDDANGDPLSVGRRTRSIPPALQRALSVRDGGCRFPGCGRTRFTEGHHIVHWADGGATELRNLVTLCRYHHRLVHEGRFGLHALDDGSARDAFVFTRPDGSRIEPNGRRPIGC